MIFVLSVTVGEINFPMYLIQVFTLKMKVKDIDNLDENWQAKLSASICTPKLTFLDSAVCIW